MATYDYDESPTAKAARGPITQHLSAKAYLESNKVPQMFQSLIAGLMLERPENHLHYLDDKLEEIKEAGPEEVNWESFVHHMHPSRQPIHNEYIKDGPPEAPSCGPSPGPVEQVQKDNEMKPFADMEPKEQYNPKVFQLTEPIE